MKRPQNDLVRDAVETLIAHGFAPKVSNAGKHFKISWVAAGHHKTLVVSRSPSDWRARAETRAMLRRLLRASEQETRP